jgi:hypothetical protein
MPFASFQRVHAYIDVAIATFLVAKFVVDITVHVQTYERRSNGPTTKSVIPNRTSSIINSNRSIITDGSLPEPMLLITRDVSLSV